jgi:hypothetical protein
MMRSPRAELAARTMDGDEYDDDVTHVQWKT